jgi:aspartate/methionine/tyrosine aminotransferase
LCVLFKGSSKFIPGGAFYLPVDITTSGLSSREFALELLNSKRVGVAPGIAFDTGYASEPLSYLQGELTSERIEKPHSKFLLLNLIYYIYNKYYFYNLLFS